MEQADRALDELCVAVEDARRLLDAVLVRAEVLREERSKGRAYHDIVAESRHPLVVEMLTEVLDELAVAGSAFRRAEARALQAGGLNQEAIAALFGVTRQRVSVLLREPQRAARPAPGAG